MNSPVLLSHPSPCGPHEGVCCAIGKHSVTGLSFWTLLFCPVTHLFPQPLKPSRLVFIFIPILVPDHHLAKILGMEQQPKMSSLKKKNHNNGRERRRVSFSNLVEDSDGEIGTLEQPSFRRSVNRPETHSDYRAYQAHVSSSEPHTSNLESRNRHINNNNKESDENSPSGNQNQTAYSGGAIPTGGQHIFTHHTGGPRTGFWQNLATSANTQGYSDNNTWNPSPTAAHVSSQHSFNMSGGSYSHREPPCYGVHFQPQVPDTTNGPYVHTYVPRHDAGGAYMGQPGVPGFPGYPVAVSGGPPVDTGLYHPVVFGLVLA